MSKEILWTTVLALLLTACGDPPNGGSTVDPPVNPGVAPKVIATSPPLSSRGPYAEWDSAVAAGSPAIKVTFNSAMNEASVRAAIAVGSNLRTLYLGSSRIYSDESKTTFTLSPATSSTGSFSPYRFGEILTLSLSAAAMDANGNSMNAGVIGTLEPEPLFRVKRMTRGAQPRGSSVAIPILLECNNWIDASIAPFASIVPDSSATWSIGFGGMTLVAWIGAPIVGQEYIVTILAGAPDADGHAAPVSFTGGISAGPLSVLWATPPDGSAGVSRMPAVVISLSASIDSIMTWSSVHITPETAVVFNVFGAPNEIHFFPADPLAPGTTYTVTVDTTLDAGGGHRLGAPYTFSFTTEVVE